MSLTTKPQKYSNGKIEDALVGENASGHIAPAVVLVDDDGVAIGTGADGVDPSEALHTYLLDTTTIDMVVDGSSTAVDYMYTVAAGKKLLLQRILVFMDDATAFDPALFGGITALPNGIDIIAGGSTLVNWKNNLDIVTTMFDFVGYPNLGKATDSGAGRWAMSKSFGGALELAATETVIARVQDNLAGLTNLRMSIQGRLITL